ncbi:MAG: bifunctional diguanylate cyclase/phosphodiesterase [Acidobacteriota bacterium]|nr:bifunctional diguanylate cyclase/phosphodiesterase [Acidobacteriota bacterium]
MTALGQDVGPARVVTLGVETPEVMEKLRDWTRQLDSQPVVATPQVMATTGALFYLTGAAVVAVVALGVTSPRTHPAILWSAAAAAGMGAVAVFCYGTRMDRWSFGVMNVIGTLLVSLVVVASGPGVGAASIAVLFVYVPLDSYFFFRLKPASTFHLFGVVCLVLLGASSYLSVPEVAGLILVNTIVAVVVAWLVRAAATAETDPLTGLLNREGFNRVVRSVLASLPEAGATLALGFVEIDHFAEVNSHFGSHHGDDLLKELSGRFCSQLPPGATLARFSGDGFAFVVPHADAAEAQQTLQHLCRSSDHRGITFSGGVAAAVAGESASMLVSRARAALLEAKTAGRNRIVVSVNDQAAIAELAHAIATGQLTVFYQPIVTLRGGGQATLAGAEALVRWDHPERGMLPPADFIDLAESAGLIGLLGESVLAEACTQAATWPEELKISVNASGRQLIEAGFATQVLAVLDRTGLSADRLVIEVTESTLEADAGPAVANLQTLRAAGIRVALDDFGTGYSSLSRLDTLPIDIVKLDRSFVSRLSEANDASPVVAAACAITQTLGLRMVAEGIEDPAQARILAGYGCDEGQGYFYGRPAPDLLVEEPEGRFRGPVPIAG